MEKKSVEDEKDFLIAAEDINVSDIMQKIKDKIQDKMDSGVLKQREIDELEEMELLPLPDFLDIPNAYKPHLYPEHPQKEVNDDYSPIIFKGEVEDGIVKKLMVLAPIIRFMIRPLYNELKSFTVELHNQNKYDFHITTKNIIRNLDSVSVITTQSKEYIKLLHNTINNMIVENSKMRIEDELMKTKLKVLEDKIEFLENRERALEKKVYK